ncbi:MAG: hypothetical protein LBN00_03730 [Oscillospiraceae bacterium]|nr:hypothetical protein [Oscillospiraceae bacterium]
MKLENFERIKELKRNIDFFDMKKYKLSEELVGVNLIMRNGDNICFSNDDNEVSLLLNKVFALAKQLVDKKLKELLDELETL